MLQDVHGQSPKGRGAANALRRTYCKNSGVFVGQFLHELSGLSDVRIKRLKKEGKLLTGEQNAMPSLKFVAVPLPPQPVFRGVFGMPIRITP